MKRITSTILAFLLAAALPVLSLATEAKPTPTTSPGPGIRPENRLTVHAPCIEWCARQQLIENVSEHFDPFTPVTHAEVAEALYRLNRGPQASLADLCQGLDRAHALWSGEPERAITRQELARTLHRWRGEPEPVVEEVRCMTVDQLDDEADIAPYARKAVDWAMSTHILPYYYFSDGQGHDYFLPQGAVTQNDLAQVLYLLYLLDGPPCPLDPEAVDFVLLREGGLNQEGRRIEDPEEIRCFLELLNGFQAESARLVPAAIGCATHSGFVIFPKAKPRESISAVEKNALLFSSPEPGVLCFELRWDIDVNIEFTAPLPSPFPEDEFARWIYGLPGEAD